MFDLIRYTICFIRRRDALLLINRNKDPWMGMWNGVGGKIEAGETPEASVLREVREETGLRLPQVRYTGIVWWTEDGVPTGGMYAFVAQAPNDVQWAMPRTNSEGILAWKSLDWILDPNNSGVVPNIRSYLPSMLQPHPPGDYHCIFANNRLLEIRHEPYSGNDTTELPG